MKAVAYARYSSDNQRDESIDAQLRAIREYAAAHGMTIVGEYIDRAKSATTDKRPKFQAMIEDAKGGEFKAVLVHKLDRFSRNRYDSAYYKRKLRQANVNLFSVIERIDDSPESIIMESVLEGMAEYYSKNLAREVRKGMKETALQCKATGGVPPLGYRVNPITRKYEIDEHEAEAVRIIFDMVIDGQGYIPIVQALNAKGYRTKAGNTFSKTSLYQILVNEKYKGIYIFNRAAPADENGTRNNHREKPSDEVIRIPGGIPAIISPGDFDLVQSIMKARKNKNSRLNGTQNFLLTGKMFCGECGSAYIGSSKRAGRNKQLYVTYRCNRRAAKSHDACDNKEIRREYIEPFVLRQLAEVLFNEDMRAAVIRSYNDYLSSEAAGKHTALISLRSQQKEATRKLNNLAEAIAEGGAATLVRKVDELERQKEEIEAQIRQEELVLENSALEEEKIAKGFDCAKELLQAGTLKNAQRLVNQYVDKVVIYKEHVEVDFNVLSLLWSGKKHNSTAMCRAVVLENGGGGQRPILGAIPSGGGVVLKNGGGEGSRTRR